jgi:hypothetical protein
VLASGFGDPGAELPAPEPTEFLPQPEPHRPGGDGGRVYGEAQQVAGEAPLTPTRLLPQAPTPSGELVSMAEDLHVPAIIRMTHGKLPLE